MQVVAQRRHLHSPVKTYLPNLLKVLLLFTAFLSVENFHEYRYHCCHLALPWMPLLPSVERDAMVAISAPDMMPLMPSSGYWLNKPTHHVMLAGAQP